MVVTCGAGHHDSDPLALYGSKVEVSRHDEDYDAKVVAVSTDCDCALLTVWMMVWISGWDRKRWD